MEQNEEFKIIDDKTFKDMCYGALNRLKEQQSYIDSLNVFPVPDGDTGTNMLLTLQEAVENLDKSKSKRIDKLTQALSKGALMGARGNSGVILSQLLRGFSEANKGKQVMDSQDMIHSLSRASKIAYQGVLRPVEGTILTVARKAAERAEELKETKDLEKLLNEAIRAAHTALNKTPEQLPQLKEAGVVDAGGQGYLIILKGMLAGLTGKIEIVEEEKIKKTVTEEREAKELKYGYCTQTLIEVKNTDVDINEIKEDIEQFGDSMMVVGDDDIIKIHIHTDHPGIILEYALKTGSLRDITIDNMRIQSAEMRKESEKQQQQEFEQIQEESEEKIVKNKKTTQMHKKIGIIAVAKGDGIKNILLELGVDLIIDGGQSMNPSTNDFVEAVKEIKQEEIIIFPNNKNIISAAKQAKSLSDKEVRIIETRTIPEAIAALLIFNDQNELDELKTRMEKETKQVKTIEITNAVKDSKVNGFKINQEDVIGIVNGTIKAVGDDELDVIEELIDKEWECEDLITIYYGDGADYKEAEKIKEKFEEFSKDVEIEIYEGGQPLYPYIISLE